MIRLRKQLPAVLFMSSLAATAVLPIHAAEINNTKECQPFIFFDNGPGEAIYDEPSLFERTFFEQRREATCEDMRTARALYSVLVACAFFAARFALGRGLSARKAVPFVALGVLALAVWDGPGFPLLLASMSLLSLLWAIPKGVDDSPT